MQKSIAILLGIAAIGLTIVFRPPSAEETARETYLLLNPSHQVSAKTQGVTKAAIKTQGCDSESSAHSRFLGEESATSIEFVDSTPRTRKVYWLDYSGQRQHYISLRPSESHVQRTFLTHPWLVTNSDELCIAIYLPTANPTRAIFK